MLPFNDNDSTFQGFVPMIPRNHHIANVAIKTAVFIYATINSIEPYIDMVLE